MKKECYPEYSGDAEFKTSDIRKNRWFFYTQNLETFRNDITHLHTSSHVRHHSPEITPKVPLMVRLYVF